MSSTNLDLSDISAFVSKDLYNDEALHKSEIIKDINTIISIWCEHEKPYNFLLEVPSKIDQNSPIVPVINKQKELMRRNLFKLAKKSERILDVGIDKCYSVALYYLANPNVKILGFDNCYKDYVEPICEYINSKCELNIISGETNIKIRDYYDYQMYGLIHIKVPTLKTVNDVIYCKKFSNNDTRLVINESNQHFIENSINTLIDKRIITEIDYEMEDLNKSTFHRIFKYI